jgi:integrase
MARRKRGERVKGIYEYRRGRKRFRVVCVDAEGKKTADYFATRAEAVQHAEWIRSQLSDESTLDRALEGYEKHMRSKGNKERSIKTTAARLRAFWGGAVDLPSLTIAKLQAAYDRRRELVSVDTGRNELSETKTLLKWAYKRSLVSKALVSKLDEVEGVGKRKKGKPQLRVDEARTWLAKAIELAEKGEAGAVAAMMTLMMAPRCFEIVERVVRDVDDDGRLLWIDRSKTDAGTRYLRVPERLRPYLLRLTHGRKPDELLFGQHWRDWPRKQVQRICRAAKVPVVTAHGMRGLHSTLAHEAGCTAEMVAAQLGHSSITVTHQNYTAPSAVASGRQQRVEERLGTTNPVVVVQNNEEPARGHESAPSGRNTVWN